SYLTPEEQLAIIDRIIDELNKKEKEEAEEAAREEFLANQNANGSQLNSSNAPASYTANTSDSWYFYNPSTVSAGKTEFQRRWGSRKLEDDWRRRNKAAFSFDDFNESSDSDDGSDDDTSDADSSSEDAGEEPVDEEKAKREADPHFPEYYLKSIPTDSTSRALSHDLIREGLFNMGVILKDKMEDYPAAREQFIALNTRYPDNINRLDAYFNMYLMYARENDIAGMERYRNLIISDFPDSKQGIALKDPDYIDNLRKMESEQNILYDRALEAYLDNRNADVHAAYDSVAVRYPMSQLMPRFMFLHALAYVTDNRPDDFKATLNEMLQRYPDTDLSTYASAWLSGLAKGRELQAGSGENLRGMFWNIHLGDESEAFDGDPTQLEFDLNPDDEQILVLLYPTDRISTNALLFNIARHNFSTFSIMDFDLETMNYGQLGLLLIRGFDNLAQINHYRSLMQQNPDLSIPAGVIPVVISEKNFATMMSHCASFEQYIEFARDKTYRDTEESV
ncbi:MAG: tetratricopeptide repeat protein, partial [Muribaculaceae bacterium]|nr:tetratricopeptide repeat protein [Muribaculaceae bacterium]